MKVKFKIPLLLCLSVFSVFAEEKPLPLDWDPNEELEKKKIELSNWIFRSSPSSLRNLKNASKGLLGSYKINEDSTYNGFSCQMDEKTLTVVRLLTKDEVLKLKPLLLKRNNYESVCAAEFQKKVTFEKGKPLQGVELTAGGDKGFFRLYFDESCQGGLIFSSCGNGTGSVLFNSEITKVLKAIMAVKPKTVPKK